VFMIEGSQLRSARALLRQRMEDVALRAGVSVATLHRMETTDGPPLGASGKTLCSVIAALEREGIRFICSAAHTGVVLVRPAVERGSGGP
jgi:hypothetical protein